jgi:hypothetical protein
MQVGEDSMQLLKQNLQKIQGFVRCKSAFGGHKMELHILHLVAGGGDK